MVLKLNISCNLYEETFSGDKHLIDKSWFVETYKRWIYSIARCQRHYRSQCFVHFCHVFMTFTSLLFISLPLLVSLSLSLLFLLYVFLFCLLLLLTITNSNKKYVRILKLFKIRTHIEKKTNTHRLILASFLCRLSGAF